MPSLFDNLPFAEAIEALRKRLAISKEKFLELDRAARSKAFTMAWVGDEHVLENIHDELAVAINNGETFAEFERRLLGKPALEGDTAEGDSVAERTGWTGTARWHHRLVYEQNLGMAYSAGRVEQGTESGLRVWRYLPSISDVPRIEHEEYYHRLYRFEPGSPVPPIDFNCTCGWEWVFPEELEEQGIDPAALPVFDPPVPKSGFQWSPADYVSGAETLGLGPLLAAERGHAALLVAAGQATLRPDVSVPQTWIEALSTAGQALVEDKLAALRNWMIRLTEEGMTLDQIRNRLVEGFHVLRSADELELNRLAVLAATLAGRARELNRQDAKDAKGVQT